MARYKVRYHRKPYNFHDPANATVEAPTPDAALALVRDRLGDGPNGVSNYSVGPATEVDLPVGTILDMAD